MANKWTSLLNNLGKQTEKKKKINRIITKPISSFFLLLIVVFIIVGIAYKSLPKEEGNKEDKSNEILVEDFREAPKTI